MSDRQWLVLSALPGMGARRLARLACECPVWPDGWLSRLPEQAASALRLWLDHPQRSPFGALFDGLDAWLTADPRNTLLHPDHPAWPALLAQLPDPPGVLWASGDLTALSLPTLAIVGSRRPSREGLHQAHRFGRELAERGWCVVSGLALGVDGAAQEAALNTRGRSIAVLGCGVDVIYPPRHATLYRRLLDEGGLLLSEHPPGTRARPAFFPRRNRIVTGVSLGVLVVEAAEKSGSLVSARLAIEQNRELFALPGSLNNPQARGCLNLIREGAVLTTCVDDILDELGHWAETPGTRSAAPAVPGSDDDDPMLGWLSDVPTPLDALVTLTGQDVTACQLQLLELELEGLATQAAGGWIRLPR
ncbi:MULTISPECIES: DNA-processing protein DprA [Halomonadaceae]|uniref:DNA-processing protein DprA n=1 Tax=unclassified Halomonas TaxID=2609666 RepID=UPI001599D18C|nr:MULTISPECIES: DNA-processing protein DprA [Halomonas]QJQ97005.1 DNA-protecting protein DprA [Halomonas sp. PA5]